MGVPALFRWLSKKYPKIVDKVIEEDPIQVPSEDDPDVFTSIPVDLSGKNPNGQEFDNLYLDMNGIVHPCTHPEGKPAPETEQDMMLEIFAYTERVVSMVRPRKLLFMAIDGVAPRAKMNQQRSRRFRAAQEAMDKEREKEEAIALFASMGHSVSDETKNKKSWDSNAITPGTPFMDLLAASLRYWVVQKMNTDQAWKNIQVIISDASVPGEGEHKIMDYIRRQRSHSEHDPNTQHVIYGLDADLIMLALATHEPNFKVLREDVFFQPNGGAGCRKCGELGHIAANCTGEKPEKKAVTGPAKPLSETKPFIFLDVGILREYLEVELDVPSTPFPFDLERAMDDWVFLIFFVGNDFLPHLPSLEIREGAIDTLLGIWKRELPRMGGYVTNHGRVELERAQVMLEGLAKAEDDIFRRRREAEERQENNAKRRRVEENRRQGREPPRERDTGGQDSKSNLVGMQLNGETLVQIQPSKVADPKIVNPSLPARPAFDLVPASQAALASAPLPNAFPPQVPATVPAKDTTSSDRAKGMKAAGGSNNEFVKNRRAIRMANMSAAELLKAELAGSANEANIVDEASTEEEQRAEVKPEERADEPMAAFAKEESTELTALPSQSASDAAFDAAFPPPPSTPATASKTATTPASHGHKRKADEVAEEDATIKTEIDGLVDAAADDVLEDPPVTELTSIPHMDQPVQEPKGRKVNPDGTVEYEDTVKLWEPGYKERYYREKFGVELSDTAFRKKLTTHYIEGLCWVLHYYYQGTPSWQWYYPYHYAPFAADFENVGDMDIKFTLGAPFKPFEQLMGVFPAASKIHIPEIFHDLMTDERSPIIDFYPEDFEIDMNGKKMQWQGVALLPFIDPTRLLAEMQPRYPQLSEDHQRRNSWGSDVLFVSEEHPLYEGLCKLYSKKKVKEPVPIDANASGGLSGFALADPTCVPGSTYDSPLTETPMGDIYGDQSLSVRYFFPKQITPHRSVMLPGVQRPKRVLNQGDLDRTRRGGNDNSRGGRGGGHMGGPGMGGGGRGRGSPMNYGGGGRSGYDSPNYGGRASPAGSNYSSGSYPGTPQSGYGGYGNGNRSGFDSPTPYGRGGMPAPGQPPFAGMPAPTMPPAQGGYGGYGGGYAPPPPGPGYGPPPPGPGYNQMPTRPPPFGQPPMPQQQGGYGGYGGYAGYGASGSGAGGRGGHDGSRGGGRGGRGGRY